MHRDSNTGNHHNQLQVTFRKLRKSASILEILSEAQTRNPRIPSPPPLPTRESNARMGCSVWASIIWSILKYHQSFSCPSQKEQTDYSIKCIFKMHSTFNISLQLVARLHVPLSHDAIAAEFSICQLTHNRIMSTAHCSDIIVLFYQ